MAMGRTKNIKWELIAYFVVATFLIIGAVFVGWSNYFHEITETSWWITFVILLFGIGIAVGYLAAQRFQNKVYQLHLAMLQMANGNLKIRIPLSGAESFEHVYKTFNQLAETMENRIKMLQKLGEENATLTGSVEVAVLEERKRLARDLHDTVSQQLFALHMSASSLPKVLEKNPDAAKEVIGQLIQMSHHAQKQMRGLIAQLRPLELQGQPLPTALGKWFPDYCRQNSIQGILDIQLKEPLSDGKEQQLFLIIQEAIANVVKHAEASVITLSLFELETQHVLSISDNGKGFQRDAVKNGSYGLSTMKERAQKLGGTVEILTNPGAGTQVKVHIPKL